MSFVEALPSLYEIYELLVIFYVRPNHIGHVIISCLSFLVMMLTMCYLVERTNPERDVQARKVQIKHEILESIPAVFASTSVSLFVLNFLYPLRWGKEAPVFPDTLSAFAYEFVYWMVCFEVFVYYLHRGLHLRKPVDVYKYIHRKHHVYFFPTAFASQAIDPLEAVLFATTSLLACLFLVPISVCTQYVCGIMLLVWSIFAHDSRFYLDHGAHYEHHSHPQTNFGFLGFMDLLHQTIYWGSAYDDGSKLPQYVARWKPWHEYIYGSLPPVIHVDSSSPEQRQESRFRYMREKFE